MEIQDVPQATSRPDWREALSTVRCRVSENPRLGQPIQPNPNQTLL
jgi:hypothetical protein